MSIDEQDQNSHVKKSEVDGLIRSEHASTANMEEEGVCNVSCGSSNTDVNRTSGGAGVWRWSVRGGTDVCGDVGKAMHFAQ